MDYAVIVVPIEVVKWGLASFLRFSLGPGWKVVLYLGCQLSLDQLSKLVRAIPYMVLLTPTSKAFTPSLRGPIVAYIISRVPHARHITP